MELIFVLFSSFNLHKCIIESNVCNVAVAMWDSRRSLQVSSWRLEFRGLSSPFRASNESLTAQMKAQNKLLLIVKGEKVWVFQGENCRYTSWSMSTFLFVWASVCVSQSCEMYLFNKDDEIWRKNSSAKRYTCKLGHFPTRSVCVCVRVCVRVCACVRLSVFLCMCSSDSGRLCDTLAPDTQFACLHHHGSHTEAQE